MTYPATEGVDFNQTVHSLLELSISFLHFSLEYNFDIRFYYRTFTVKARQNDFQVEWKVKYSY